MKKTFRKLMLVLAIVAVIMSFAAVSASAADCTHEVSRSVTVAPTCTEQGYDLVICIDCGAQTKTNFTTPVGHSLLDRVYSVNGDGYKLTRDCGRTHKALDLDSNGNIQFDSEGKALYKDVDCDFVYTSDDTYYKVSFKNPCSVAAYDETIVYTNVVTQIKTTACAPADKASADFEADDTVDPAREYYKAGDEIILLVKEGKTAAYNGNAPVRSKDYNYGAYTFDGWYDQNVTASTNASGVTVIDLANTAITKNTEFYAQFKGVTKYYNVKFVDYNGLSLSENGVTVCHGEKVTYDAANPTREADVRYMYEFAGWLYDGKDVNLDKIYGDIRLTAKYSTIDNVYKITYLDGMNLPIEGADEEVIYGQTTKGYSTITAERLEKPADKQFVYVYTGKWTFLENPKHTTTLSNFTVPEYYTNAEGETVKTADGAEFTLVPVYNSQKVLYTYKFQVVNTLFDDNDKKHTLKDFSIQIRNAEGQLVATGKTDADGVLYQTLNYSTYFTITAVSSDNKYLAEQTIAAPVSAADTINYIIRPSRNPDFDSEHHSSCGCICHNAFLKPLIVRIYNLLYRIFNIKYTCCYDMYANIGSLLAYTAD